MNWARESAGVALILGSGMVIIVLVESWARRARPSAEVARKLLHIAGILPCLFIPWLIHSTSVAVVLALALAAGLWSGARFGLLRSVSGVARRSHGEAYYPVALLAIFMLAGDRTWMFLSALLTFGVADALAALIGSTRGKLRYQVEDDEKSLLGSLVFLAVAFAAVALPLLVIARLPWPDCLLAALLTALLATGIEAVSLRGFDNLSVPLGVCIVLDRLAGLPWQDLLAKNLFLLGLLAGVGTVARLTRQISPAAAVVFVLFIYAAFEFADWRWALAPGTAVLIYVLVQISLPPPRGFQTRVSVIIPGVALAPALLVLTLADVSGAHGFLQGPHLACLGAALYFALRVYLGCRGVLPPRTNPALVGLSGVIIGMAPAAPAWFFQQAPVSALAAIAAVCGLLAIVHEFTPHVDGKFTASELWTAPRFLLTCAAALIIVVLQGGNLIPPWPEPEFSVIQSPLPI